MNDEPRFVSWKECFDLRQQCREDMEKDIQGVDDRMIAVAEECKDTLKDMTNEMKEFRKDMTTFFLNVSLALLAFAATVLAAIIAVIYYIMN